MRRIGVVECDFHAAGQARQFAERCDDRILGQIGRDAEPQHESPFGRAEPAGLKRSGHASVLEIMGDVRDMPRFCDLRFGEAPSLVALGRGMIELEYGEIPGRGKTVGEGVETRAEHQDLPHALVDCPARRVLREAAAHRDEETQGPPLRLFLGERDRFVRVLPEDGERERVGEYDPALENLMRRSMARRANRGAARLPMLHWARVEAEGRPSKTSLTAKNPSPIDRPSYGLGLTAGGTLLDWAARFHVCRTAVSKRSLV